MYFVADHPKPRRSGASKVRKRGARIARLGIFGRTLIIACTVARYNIEYGHIPNILNPCLSSATVTVGGMSYSQSPTVL